MWMQYVRVGRLTQYNQSLSLLQQARGWHGTEVYMYKESREEDFTRRLAIKHRSMLEYVYTWDLSLNSFMILEPEDIRIPQ